MMLYNKFNNKKSINWFRDKIIIFLGFRLFVIMRSINLSKGINKLNGLLIILHLVIIGKSRLIARPIDKIRKQ